MMLSICLFLCLSVHLLYLCPSAVCPSPERRTPKRGFLKKLSNLELWFLVLTTNTDQCLKSYMGFSKNPFLYL